MSRIGSKINAVRIGKGLTRKQLAKSVGVAEKFIEEVESGKRVLNDDLIKRISKVLEQDVGENIYEIPADDPREEKRVKEIKKPETKEIQQVWNDAFDTLLKSVPIYDYSLSKVIDTRQLPVIANKVDGFAKDKVCFLQIQDNEMSGFRIVRGDLAFAFLTHEVENNTICLVEYNEQRAVRQIKRLDNDRVILVSNLGSLTTETVLVKNLKVLARLVKVEIKL